MNISETLTALTQADVDFVLDGGVAVTLQGVLGGTLDLDCVLSMNDANLDRFIDVAETIGMTRRVPVVRP